MVGYSGGRTHRGTRRCGKNAALICRVIRNLGTGARSPRSSNRRGAAVPDVHSHPHLCRLGQPEFPPPPGPRPGPPGRNAELWSSWALRMRIHRPVATRRKPFRRPADHRTSPQRPSFPHRGPRTRVGEKFIERHITGRWGVYGPPSFRGATRTLRIVGPPTGWPAPVLQRTAGIWRSHPKKKNCWPGGPWPSRATVRLVVSAYGTSGAGPDAAPPVGWASEVYGRRRRVNSGLGSGVQPAHPGWIQQALGGVRSRAPGRSFSFTPAVVRCRVASCATLQPARLAGPARAGRGCGPAGACFDCVAERGPFHLCGAGRNPRPLHPPDTHHHQRRGFETRLEPPGLCTDTPALGAHPGVHRRSLVPGIQPGPRGAGPGGQGRPESPT